MGQRKRESQGELRFIGWGGKRDGAGRPRARGAKVRHEERAPLAARYPAHVTLRALPGTPNLRLNAQYAVIEQALRKTLVREDFRVVHFAAQSNHMHLLVEAHGAEALSRGMQGLAIRIARGVNRTAGRSGKLWADRYHVRILRSPREVRLALCYALQNTRRHATTESEMVDPEWIDPRSSGPWFDGWRSRPGSLEVPAVPAPTADPQTWLLAEGWRRHGLLRVDEVPSAAFA